MKFLCLICADKVMEQMATEMAEQHYRDYATFTEDIRRSGHFLDCNRLLPPAEATTIRVRDGKIGVTDGPWVETKEQLGGYYLVEARDLNEAIRIAAKIPGAWHGCVEVRPVAEDVRTLTALGKAAEPTRVLS